MKKEKVLDLTKKEPLIDRQRRLWAHAEAIEIAQARGLPLPVEISEWLHRALKNIASGEDANAVFNVIPEKRGVRKDGFKREIQAKFANGHVAAATESAPGGPAPKKTAQAITEISNAMPQLKRSTVRKNWNSRKTDRKPTFTLGRK